MQLLVKVDQVIGIFEEVYPNCVALFMFNHSSTHASLRPDALCAFDINKSNGGKMRKQKDTMIPMTNPTIKCRGKAQRMMTKAGEPKGL
jgi:hypothetical protein